MRTEGVSHAKISDKALQTERTASTEILKPSEQASGIRGTEAQPVWLELNDQGERRTRGGHRARQRALEGRPGKELKIHSNGKSWRVH